MTFGKDVLDIFHQSQNEWFEKTGIRLDDNEFMTFLINTTKANKNK